MHSLMSEVIQQVYEEFIFECNDQLGQIEQLDSMIEYLVEFKQDQHYIE